MRPQSAARGPEPAVQFGRALDANGQAHPRGRDSQESEASPHAGSASGVGAEALPVIEVTPQLWEAFAAWDVPDPDSGQVWRLRWNDVVALAVIDLRRDPQTFSVLPISEDPQFATDSDLILEPGESPLDMPAMVGVALEMVLHRRVLDRCLGRIGARAWGDLRRLRNAFVHSEPSELPLGRVGPPVTHELDDRLQYRSEQREAYAPLVFAEWYEAPASKGTGAELLGGRLQELGLSLKGLADASGLSVQVLVQLLREEAPPLGQRELERLARALSLDIQKLRSSLAERFPDELVEALDKPEQKARIYKWCEKWQSDEAESRRHMARSLSSRARRAKQVTVRDWSHLLEEQFPL
jgi:transcriptional regulator with XRE-family HTH domain